MNRSGVNIKVTDSNAFVPGARVAKTGLGQRNNQGIGGSIMAGLTGALNQSLLTNDRDFRMQNPEYAQFYQMGMEIKEALLGNEMQGQGNMTQAIAPEMVSTPYATDQMQQGMQSQPQMMPGAQVTCPYCNATTTPDASGKCEFCGAQIG